MTCVVYVGCVLYPLWSQKCLCSIADNLFVSRSGVERAYSNEYVNAEILFKRKNGFVGDEGNGMASVSQEQACTL